MIAKRLRRLAYRAYFLVNRRVSGRAGDRGDVPGWVLITVMTAGLVTVLWAVAGERLNDVFGDAIDKVVGSDGKG